MSKDVKKQNEKKEVEEKPKVYKNSDLFEKFGLAGFKDTKTLRDKIIAWHNKNGNGKNGRGYELDPKKLLAQISGWLKCVDNGKGRWKPFKFEQKGDLTVLVRRD